MGVAVGAGVGVEVEPGAGVGVALGAGVGVALGEGVGVAVGVGVGIVELLLALPEGVPVLGFVRFVLEFAFTPPQPAITSKPPITVVRAN